MLARLKSRLHMASVAYAATNMANGLMNSVFMFYYVKTFLNRYHVPESWFHVSQIIYMVWNAVNDPLFGYIQDNYDFSWVKTRRHSVLYGAPFFALGFLLPWFPWADYSNPDNGWICGMHLMFALCFYDTMFTFVLLAQCAIFTEMSNKQEDRVRLVRYSQAASMIGSSAVFICETVSRHQEDYGYFQIATIGIAIVAWLCMRYTGNNAHTEYDLRNQSEAKIETGIKTSSNDDQIKSVITLTWQILKERDFISFVLTNFCQIYHYTFLSNFVAIICDGIIPYDVFSLKARTIYYGALFLMPQFLLILGTPIVSRFGYYNVIKTAFILKIIWGLAAFFIGKDYHYLLLAFFMLDRCGAKISFSLFNMPLSDISDQDSKRYKREHPLSSMVFGTNALITKPAVSVAPMLSVWILNSHGYEQAKSSGDTFSSDLLQLMFTVATLTPVFVGCVQLVLWSFYTIRQTGRPQPHEH